MMITNMNDNRIQSSYHTIKTSMYQIKSIFEREINCYPVFSLSLNAINPELLNQFKHKLFEKYAYPNLQIYKIESFKL